jgi:hypothetical protein
MRIICFILDPDLIATILCYLQCKGRDPRALPEHAARRVERAPISPPPGILENPRMPALSPRT